MKRLLLSASCFLFCLSCYGEPEYYVSVKRDYKNLEQHINISRKSLSPSPYSSSLSPNPLSASSTTPSSPSSSTLNQLSPSMPSSLASQPASRQTSLPPPSPLPAPRALYPCYSLSPSPSLSLTSVTTLYTQTEAHLKHFLEQKKKYLDIFFNSKVNKDNAKEVYINYLNEVLAAIQNTIETASNEKGTAKELLGDSLAKIKKLIEDVEKDKNDTIFKTFCDCLQKEKDKKDEKYVFYHGNTSAGAFTYDILERLRKKLLKRKDDIGTTFRGLSSTYKDIDDFLIKHIDAYGDDCDILADAFNYYGDYVDAGGLSTNVFLSGNPLDIGSSSLYFFAANVNAASNGTNKCPREIFWVLDGVLHTFFDIAKKRSVSSSRTLLDRMCILRTLAMVEKKYKERGADSSFEDGGGVLYQIFIDKNNVNKIAYMSEDYGVPIVLQGKNKKTSKGSSDSSVGKSQRNEEGAAQERIEELEAHVGELESKLKNSDISKLNAQIKQLENRNTETKSKLINERDTARRERELSRKEADRLNAEKRTLDEKYRKLENDTYEQIKKETDRLNAEKRALDEKYRKLETDTYEQKAVLYNDIQPIRSQNATLLHKNQTLEAQAQDLTKKNEKLQERLAHVEQLLSSSCNGIDTLRSFSRAYIETLEQANDEINRLRRQISEKNRNESLERYAIGLLQGVGDSIEQRLPFSSSTSLVPPPIHVFTAPASVSCNTANASPSVTTPLPQPASAAAPASVRGNANTPSSAGVTEEEMLRGLPPEIISRFRQIPGLAEKTKKAIGRIDNGFSSLNASSPTHKHSDDKNPPNCSGQ